MSRALVELYRQPAVAQALAFRGGTALHKLFFEQPGRYSEDIDVVQAEAGAIGPALDAVRAALDPWLGEPKRKLGHGRVTLVYRVETTSLPVQPMRLKIEINTREHFNVLGLSRRQWAVESPWFSGSADLTTYQVEELLGTKLRALYQRKKGATSTTNRAPCRRLRSAITRSSSVSVATWTSAAPASRARSSRRI